ncbi:NAD-dependent epimerase/dehydratase family protein [Vibrio sp.]|nr:NAD-dependent epimerase/dehydratase family protein [Vibrio sp.]
MTYQPKVLIIGAGWLGTPLAERLLLNGYHVTVTKRSNEALSSLPEPLKKNAFVLDLAQFKGYQSNTIDAAQMISPLEQKYDYVIGSFPPGFRKGEPKTYISNWENVVSISQHCHAKKVIMTSTTGVYGSLTGSCTETDHPDTDSTNQTDEKVSILRAAERMVENSGISHSILRLSGLIGPDRHPGRFVKHLKQVSQLAPANMLHQEDAINAIIFMLTHENSGIVNVSTPETTSKVAFYQAALTDYTKEAEEFPKIVALEDKKVVVSKLLSLGFTFTYQHTLETLKDCH